MYEPNSCLDIFWFLYSIIVSICILFAYHVLHSQPQKNKSFQMNDHRKMILLQFRKKLYIWTYILNVLPYLQFNISKFIFYKKNILLDNYNWIWLKSQLNLSLVLWFLQRSSLSSTEADISGVWNLFPLPSTSVAPVETKMYFVKVWAISDLQKQRQVTANPQDIFF